MKLVIYKVDGIYHITTEENYNRVVQDAKAIYKLSDANSAREIIEYYCRYCGSKPEDFIIIGGN